MGILQVAFAFVASIFGVLSAIESKNYLFWILPFACLSSLLSLISLIINSFEFFTSKKSKIKRIKTSLNELFFLEHAKHREVRAMFDGKQVYCNVIKSDSSTCNHDQTYLVDKPMLNPKLIAFYKCCSKESEDNSNLEMSSSASNWVDYVEIRNDDDFEIVYGICLEHNDDNEFCNIMRLEDSISLQLQFSRNQILYAVDYLMAYPNLIAGVGLNQYKNIKNEILIAFSDIVDEDSLDQHAISSLEKISNCMLYKKMKQRDGNRTTYPHNRSIFEWANEHIDLFMNNENRMVATGVLENVNYNLTVSRADDNYNEGEEIDMLSIEYMLSASFEKEGFLIAHKELRMGSGVTFLDILGKFKLIQSYLDDISKNNRTCCLFSSLPGVNKVTLLGENFKRMHCDSFNVFLANIMSGKYYSLSGNAGIKIYEGYYKTKIEEMDKNFLDSDARNCEDLLSKYYGSYNYSFIKGKLGFMYGKRVANLAMEMATTSSSFLKRPKVIKEMITNWQWKRLASGLSFINEYLGGSYLPGTDTKVNPHKELMIFIRNNVDKRQENLIVPEQKCRNWLDCTLRIDSGPIMVDSKTMEKSALSDKIVKIVDESNVKNYKSTIKMRWRNAMLTKHDTTLKTKVNDSHRSDDAKKIERCKPANVENNTQQFGKRRIMTRKFLNSFAETLPVMGGTNLMISGNNNKLTYAQIVNKSRAILITEDEIIKQMCSKIKMKDEEFHKINVKNEKNPEPPTKSSAITKECKLSKQVRKGYSFFKKEELRKSFVKKQNIRNSKMSRALKLSREYSTNNYYEVLSTWKGGSGCDAINPVLHEQKINLENNRKILSKKNSKKCMRKRIHQKTELNKPSKTNNNICELERGSLNNIKNIVQAEPKTQETSRGISDKNESNLLPDTTCITPPTHGIKLNLLNGKLMLMVGGHSYTYTKFIKYIADNKLDGELNEILKDDTISYYYSEKKKAQSDNMKQLGKSLNKKEAYKKSEEHIRRKISHKLTSEYDDD